MSLTKERKSSGIQIIEIGILLMITNFMTAIFLWQSILNGWKISEGGRFFFYALVQREGANVFLGIDQAGSYIGILSIISHAYIIIKFILQKLTSFTISRTMSARLSASTSIKLSYIK